MQSFYRIIYFYCTLHYIYSTFWMCRKVYTFFIKYILSQWQSVRKGEWIFHEKTLLRLWQGQTLSLELCQCTLKFSLKLYPLESNCAEIFELFLKCSSLMNFEKVLVICAGTEPNIFKCSTIAIKQSLFCHYFSTDMFWKPQKKFDYPNKYLILLKASEGKKNHKPFI